MKIRLFCVAGMSTSLLVNRMREAAKKRGEDMDIRAYSESDMEKCLDGVQAALLGPQSRLALKRARALCEPKGIPVAVIPVSVYSEMDGEKALDFAEELQDNYRRENK